MRGVEFQNFWDKEGCATVLNIGPNPSLININDASFVGCLNSQAKFPWINLVWKEVW